MKSMKTTSILVFTGLVLTAATSAVAQTSERTKAFVNINVGAQPASQTINSTVTTPVYGQLASASTSLVVTGEPMFDIDFGYRFRQNMAVAFGYSTLSSDGPIAGTASVPSPVFFNQFNTVDISGSTFNRTDHNYYFLFLYFVPITNRIEVAFFAGPTFTNVKQDLVTGITVPPGTQTATPIVQSQSGTAAGVNIGFDASYLFTKYYGVGGFLRYNGGSVDLPAASGVKAGGFQMGIGARLRF
jgi:hypothetical protein